MGKKYKIVYDMTACIDAGPCAVANPKHWKIDQDLEKAILIGGVENPNTKNFELIIDEEDLKYAIKKTAQSYIKDLAYYNLYYFKKVGIGEVKENIPVRSGFILELNG